ncbi:MAG: hypothetical protein LBP75_02815 [Planctomycetota bacterium]|jgi:hypothetical protein|nr:hypothetical protein [Planctomycetota bacterium]
MPTIAEAYREQEAPDLTAEEIEALVQNAVKKYLSPEELTYTNCNRPYLQGRTRTFTLNEMCALKKAITLTDGEEYETLHHLCPVLPDWIKGMKDFFGKEWVLDYDGDFTATEIKYGKDWLEK